MLSDQHYGVIVSNSFEKKYFDLKSAGNVFEFISRHLKEYRKLPPIEVIENTVAGSSDFLADVKDVIVDPIENQEWVMTETNLYLREKALKHAILESVDILEGKSKRDTEEIRQIVEEALTKDLKIDLGQFYWQGIPERLKNILNSNDNRIPTFYPILDEFIASGFPKRGSLSAICGATFSGKSQFAINIACRQALQGFNIVIYTFEMDEYMYAERADSIYSGFDMNKMYLSKGSMKNLVDALKEVKDSASPGYLIIKDFPTGKSTVNNLISHLRELQMRGYQPDVVFVDYIGIMKGKYPQNPYLNIKFLSEELRAMGIMFNLPVVTFHQINREGRRVPFSELSGVFVSESTALEHNCDFMALIGFDEDAATYENTIFWKITKNRFGGRKATVPFYVDSCSLKIYDDTELEVWMADAQRSGDMRNIFEKAA
jgi:replicative DNA helicase